MNIDSILVSDYAAKVGEKLIVIGAFDLVQPRSLPFQMPQIALSLAVSAHRSEAGMPHEMRTQLLNQRREVLAEEVVEFGFEDDGTHPQGMPFRMYHTVTVLAPVFSEEGLYAFEVYIDETYAATASFFIQAADG